MELIKKNMSILRNEIKMDERILAVQRMQDYIENKLCEDITLADLSHESLFSPWYSL